MEEKYEIIAVPTRILTKRDDLAKVIPEYAKGQIGPDDVVCVASKMVAITQGMAVRCEELHPGILAKHLSHLFPSKGSISSWYSMQALISLEGGLRVVFAVIIGFIAKCFGISGVFYRLAGYQSSIIDDVTGSVPPYDKYIVYAPLNPVEVAEAIKDATGAYGAAITDVNDLKRSAVLGASEGIDGKDVADILIDNPFGNGSEKTPICIIKNYRKA